MNVEDFVKILKIPSATLNVIVKTEDLEGVVKRIQELMKDQVLELYREKYGTKIILTNKTIAILRMKESLKSDKVLQFEEIRMKT